MNLGHLQTKMLTFVNERPGFHHIRKDRDTLRVANSLAKRNLIILEEYLGDYTIRAIDSERVDVNDYNYAGSRHHY
ncbi:hypothetical protein BOW86_gp100 [Synechococcus phage S-CAM7]|uniref:Uncharacterized protein n=1 Tax=Synechococcus phage S-CAM7 TaxID=1883368 RepID=A0A1D8KTX7_9CAUD|nr:hypothetical protein BOW86_gp100 [Synechococcus phage S-CAM7]AOV62024.1 hypothetical protein C490910_100 [Synechococcus phage S-CAM7]AOV62288.1 hypothetical protein S420910_099 [Synechococcus phage S-CAM7]QLF86152.1 hypothetical protein CC030809_00096 [Synechococcus phage S-CAM7]